MGDLPKIYHRCTVAFQQSPLSQFTSFHCPCACLACVCGSFGYFYNWPRHRRTCPYALPISLFTHNHTTICVHMRLTKAEVGFDCQLYVTTHSPLFRWIRLPSFVTIIITSQRIQNLQIIEYYHRLVANFLLHPFELFCQQVWD